jgi:hypothetical protein
MQYNTKQYSVVKYNNVTGLGLFSEKTSTQAFDFAHRVDYFYEGNNTLGVCAFVFRTHTVAVTQCK